MLVQHTVSHERDVQLCNAQRWMLTEARLWDGTTTTPYSSSTAATKRARHHRIYITVVVVARAAVTVTMTVAAVVVRRTMMGRHCQQTMTGKEGQGERRTWAEMGVQKVRSLRWAVCVTVCEKVVQLYNNHQPHIPNQHDVLLGSSATVCCDLVCLLFHHACCIFLLHSSC